MPRWAAKRLYCLGDGENVTTVLTGCRCSAGRAFVWIEGRAAMRTVNARVLHVGGENSSASGTADAHFRFAVWICISAEDVRREQVHALGARWARHHLDPKIIERIANMPLAVGCAIQRANFFAHARRKSSERLQ